MKATFFNQPWLERRYRAGHAAAADGQVPGAAAGFRVSEHARDRRASAADGRGRGHLSGHGRADLDADRSRSRTSTARRRATALEPLPARLRVHRAAARPPRRARRRALRRPGGRAAGGWRSTSCCCCRSRCCAAARAAARRARADAAGAAGRADRRAGSRDSLPFTPDRRPARGDGRRSTTTSRGERPMQRLLMGEVGSGKTVVALYAMLRAVESGAQAALMAPTETLAEQHFATLQKLMPGELVQAALLTGSTPAGAPRRPARQAGQRRAEAARRHPRADRGGGRVRPPRRRRGRRAAPLRRQPAPRAGPQGAGRASRRTSCT